MTTNARTVAREWLLLIASIAVGLTVVPMALSVVTTFEAALFYAALVSEDSLLAWLVVIAPYLVLLFGRSIAWSFRVVRRGHAGPE